MNGSWLLRGASDVAMDLLQPSCSQPDGRCRTCVLVTEVLGHLPLHQPQPGLPVQEVDPRVWDHSRHQEAYTWDLKSVSPRAASTPSH